MTRRHHIGKWLGLCVCIGAIAAHIALMRHWVWVATISNYNIDLYAGQFSLMRFTPPRERANEWQWLYYGYPEPKFEWGFGLKFNDRIQRIGLPMWSIFLGAAIPTVVLWRRTYLACKRRRVGFCLRCGYDLAGLAAPTCPECGTKIEKSAAISVE